MFSLTGPVFLSTVAVVAVTAFIALVLIWPALGGRTPGRIVARAGMLLMVNALVLLTAATQLNAQFLFFADWTDLRGALGGTVTYTSVSRGANASHTATRNVRGTAAAAAGSSLPPLPTGRVSQTGVISYTVKGALSGITGTIVVQLPPGYTNPANASVRYPVIQAFSGYPSDPAFMVEGFNLGGVAAQEAAAGRMRPALVVSTQWEIPVGQDTECVNGAGGNPQVETWLARDVPNWVTHTFRVKTDRASWATFGISAGGWCAAMAAMLHPAQYASAIVMGGYFRPEFGPYYYPYPTRGRLAARYDLVALSRRNPPPVAIWLETSHVDNVSYSSSAAFLRAARPPLAVDAVVLQNAGHRDTLWEGLTSTSLKWLGANVSGFKAKA
jgi:enterochelin esterase-like enzyme